MDKLAHRLTRIRRVKPFVAATKVFVERWIHGNYVSKEDHDEALWEAHKTGYEEGYEAGHQQATHGSTRWPT